MPDMGSVGTEDEVIDGNCFQVGQMVKVKVPLNVLRTIQEGHGGFTPKMCESMALQGEIMEVTEKGDLRVKYPNSAAWTLNPEAVRIVSGEEDITDQEQRPSDPAGYAPNFVCVRCWENLPSNGTQECCVCSETEEMCLLEPCGHKIACVDCTSRLKKCCTCHELITRRVSPDGETVQYIPKDQRPTLDRMRYLEMQVKNFEDTTTCSICLENRKDRIFQCGHGCCRNCSQNMYTCHICRSAISAPIPLY